MLFLAFFLILFSISVSGYCLHVFDFVIKYSVRLPCPEFLVDMPCRSAEK